MLLRLSTAVTVAVVLAGLSFRTASSVDPSFPVGHAFGTGTDATYSAAAGDMDGGGDLDIITGNFDQQNVVYLNDDAGSFTAARNFGTGGDATLSAAAGLTPPATIYGQVTSAADFAPSPGMAVTAWIDGRLCSQGQVQEQGGGLVYVLKVPADDDGAYDGCGIGGRTVRIQVGDKATVAETTWDNTRVTAAIAVQHFNFLPLIGHRTASPATVLDAEHATLWSEAMTLLFLPIASQ